MRLATIIGRAFAHESFDEGRSLFDILHQNNSFRFLLNKQEGNLERIFNQNCANLSQVNSPQDGQT